MAERSVEQRLYDEGYNFDFFQAVRLLQRLTPDRARVGVGASPRQEVARFRAWPSLAFPASSIYEVARPTTSGAPPLLTVTFLGMFGPSGVLPRHYTEMILRLERERRGEERRALRDWLDLFNHRFISLFYRTWEKYRFWVGHERGEHTQPEPDPFTRCLYSLIGMGTDGLGKRLRVAAVEADGQHERLLASVDDQTLLYYAGLLSSRHRHAAGLQAIIEEYFHVPVRVHQFVGQWLALEPSSQSRLGISDGNSLLGVNTVAGERVWDVQSKIRLHLGPLTYDRFLDFLPDRAAIPEHKAFFLLVHLVRLYAGSELDFDVQLALRANEMPECQLTDDHPGPRLGWNTWLVSQQPLHDVGDAQFASEVVVNVNEGFGTQA